MTIYSQQCNFPGNVTLSGATIGWDVVYAVTYETINADLMLRKPWAMELGGGDPGVFLQQDTAKNTLSDATITLLSVAPGGQDQIVQLSLEISSANLKIDGFSVDIALTDLIATIETSLIFQPSTTTPGLHNLVIDTDGAFNVVSVTGYNVTGDREIVDLEQVILSNIINAFCLNNPMLFAGVYANVFTKDYAESVNIPWLQPKGFSYAVAPTGAGSGILAVLGSLSGDLGGLTQQVTPAMFPTNAGVNAAIAISSSTLAQSTFLANLNTVVGQSEIGPLVPDTTGQVLSNQNEISAFYAVDLANGSVSFISNPALASATATTYPVTIPVGAVKISLTDDSITTAVAGAVVDLYGGYTQSISITSAYQLVVDSPSQNVDIIISGSPVIQSDVIPPDTASTLAVVAQVGAVALGIFVGEAIPYAIDKVTGYLTNVVGATPENLYQPTLRFLGAERQMRNTNQPVTFSIGAGRQLTLRPSAGDERAGEALDPAYLNAVTLNPKYPEVCPYDASPASIEMTNQNLSSIVPLNATDSNINESGISEATGPVNANTKESIHNDVSGEVLEIVWNAVCKFPSATTAFKSVLSGAGFDADLLPDGAQINAGNLLSIKLTYDERAALYSACIKYVIAVTKSGTVTGGLYGMLVNQVAGATCDPATARSVARLPGITGFGPNAGYAGVSITATPGGNLTNAQPGLFSDFESAANTGNTDLSRLLIHEIIRSAPRPWSVKMAAIVAYVAGALGGAAGGYGVDKGIGALVAYGDEENSANVANDIEKASRNSPSSLLFSAVSFPFMERFVSGGVTGPAPANVLKCASVNGALICGVEIQLNLN